MSSPTWLGKDTVNQFAPRKRWGYFDGEVSEFRVTGPTAAVDAFYQTAVSVAGSSPTYDSIEFDPGVGVGRMLLRRIVDGAVCFELWGNSVMEPIAENKYFAALTADQVAKCFDSLARGLTETKAGFAGVQKTLYRHLLHGVTELPNSAYVLRSTQITSKRGTLTASYVDVNRVVVPPNTSTANAIIGALPAGEWLKQAPLVTQARAKSWRITQEWWWAEKWSVALGGTWLK